jgi:hypothetical protein
MNKSGWLRLRVAPEQLALAQEYAAAHEVSVSQVVRHALRSNLERAPDGSIVWAGGQPPSKRQARQDALVAEIVRLQQKLLCALGMRGAA